MLLLKLCSLKFKVFGIVAVVLSHNQFSCAYRVHAIFQNNTYDCERECDRERE